ALERSIRHAIDRKRNEAQLAQLALHDHLTGLANRSLFDERLRGALARPGGDGRRVAVLFVDIDDFKRINDGLGHNAGDRTLREAAARIRAAVRPGDVVARLGGDEFTVLCDGVPSRRAALAIGRRINDALRRPFTLDGGEIVLRASIGVALADDGTTAEELLQHSDEAMYRAKARGGGCP